MADERTLLQQKKAELGELISVLRQMDVPSLSAGERLRLELKKLLVLKRVDATELALKELEIQHDQAEHDSPPMDKIILADEFCEISIMREKAEASATLISTVEAMLSVVNAGEDPPWTLTMRKLNITMEIDRYELSLKQQQVALLQARLSVSPPGERQKVQGLLTGEEKEVGLLEKTLDIAEAVRHISEEMNAGGRSREKKSSLEARLAELERNGVRLELEINEQNIRQVDQRGLG